MLEELKSSARVAGLKQTKKAIRNGTAKVVYIAKDADKRITEPVVEVCRQSGIPVVIVGTMHELGRACDIEVGCAVAAVI